MSTPEGLVKRAIMGYLSVIANCEVFPISTIGVYDASQNRYRKSTMRAGTPDLLLCYKGIFIGIEVKSKTGRLSDSQIEIGLCIESSGGIWGVAKSLDDVRAILNRADLRLTHTLTDVK